MTPNLLVIFLAALIPLIVGSIYYHKAVLGSAWMASSGMTDDDVASGNMPLIFGLTLVFSIFIAFSLYFIVVHQAGLYSLFMGAEDMTLRDQVMELRGDAYRTFKHGMLHGFVESILFVFPIIAINALFERRSWKYIMIHTGYWVISITLMGGVVCQWA
jgi:hypothetical protein